MSAKLNNDKKNLLIGIGLSEKIDPFESAKDAATQAISKLNGKTPKFSYVFYSGNYDPYKISNGLKSILKESEFAGGSSPSVFVDDKLVHQGVLVVSLYSQYLRIGVASGNNVTKNPLKVAKNTALEAMKHIHLDKYVDPYLQFSRMKKGDLRGIMKVPTFILHVFTRGFELNKVGREVDILKGIGDAVGQYVPIFGGSLGVPLEKVFNNEDYDIFTLHSGKVLKDGMVAIILNSGLIYVNTIAHGCDPTEIMGLVEEVEFDGYVVSKISGKTPIDWYSDNLKIPKKEFVKKIMEYTQNHPLAMPDGEGGYVMRAGGMPYAKDKMSFVAPFKVGTPVIIMNAADVKMMKASNEIKSDIENHLHKKLSPAFGFGAMCASREIVLQEDTSKELKLVKKTLGLSKVPFVGFYSFGEIGSKPGQTCRFNHLTANMFLMYDKLITELHV